MSLTLDSLKSRYEDDLRRLDGFESQTEHIINIGVSSALLPWSPEDYRKHLRVMIEHARYQLNEALAAVTEMPNTQAFFVALDEDNPAAQDCLLLDQHNLLGLQRLVIGEFVIKTGNLPKAKLAAMVLHSGLIPDASKLTAAFYTFAQRHDVVVAFANAEDAMLYKLSQ